VWIATGDGDGLSIGGNHLAHLLRRNLDLKVLMFNNEIYGLTKGQYSPTSPPGTKTKSTPMGSVDRPFHPLAFALGCNATFVARTVDNDQKHMVKTFKTAAAHKGTAFVEILQNCVIFNEDFYSDSMDRDVREEKTIDLVAGEKMIYGKGKDKGLKIEGFEVKVVEAKDADTWDPMVRSSAPAFLMSMMDQDPGLPKPLGIFRAVQEATYERAVNAQVEKAIASRGRGKLRDLVWSGETWTVG
jgi:2-oxoglutarate ferredoxin oxidoreductase subunit beta